MNEMYPALYIPPRGNEMQNINRYISTFNIKLAFVDCTRITV